jgi:hypothetical protein
MSNTQKQFEIVGTSRVNGVLTFRVCNGKIKAREGILRRAGHTDISFQFLPYPMSRVEAVAFLQTQGTQAVVPAKGKVRKEMEILERMRMQVQTALQAQAAEQDSTQDKLVAKRARDAARKRERRAAERAAREQALQAGVGQLMDAVGQEFGVDAERELAGE